MSPEQGQRLPAEIIDANPVRWNPWNKVVQDHRTGEVDHAQTNDLRSQLGLPTPWTPEMAHEDNGSAPIHLGQVTFEFDTGQKITRILTPAQQRLLADHFYRDKDIHIDISFSGISITEKPD